MKKPMTENRKAMPKFLGIMLLSALAGGFIGGAAGFIGGTQVPEQVIARIYRIMARITPYSPWVITAVLGTAELVLYRRAKALFSGWDGEEEVVIERAEELLSWTLLLTSLQMILGFFFFGLIHLVDDIWLSIAGFLLTLILVMVVQQKVVDLTKRINPEKQGSIYDLKFQKTWLNSCDENEQRQIGQASYKAFMATTYTCCILFLVLMLLGGVCTIGILPLFLVALIWGISQTAYCLECIRLSRHK